MPFTHHGANKAIELLLTEYPDLYVGAFTAEPTVSGGGTEVAGGSYARVHVDSATDLSTPANSSSESENVLTFPTATGSWGSITAYGLFDDASSGNLLAWAVQSPPKPIGNGDNLAIPVGNLIVRNVAA